jgi:hypothetical protein
MFAGKFTAGTATLKNGLARVESDADLVGNTAAALALAPQRAVVLTQHRPLARPRHAARRLGRSGVRGESNNLFEGPGKHGCMVGREGLAYSLDGLFLRYVSLLLKIVIKATKCCFFKTKLKFCVFFENISCVSASECV